MEILYSARDTLVNLFVKPLLIFLYHIFISIKIENRIKKWLEDPDSNLDLSGLYIKKWPNSLQGKEYLIKSLDISDNFLKYIHPLPKCKYLNCSDNYLKIMPCMPIVKRLYCDKNLLEAISSLPECRILNAGDNLLEWIPYLPKCQGLCVKNNFITKLPSLRTCYFLDCSYNSIKTIPYIPECLILISHNNPNLPPLDWRKISKGVNYILLCRVWRRIKRVMTLRLYLPRFSKEFNIEFIYSPNHPGKFYKKLIESKQWH